jgi:hypothetical protein
MPKTTITKAQMQQLQSFFKNAVAIKPGKDGAVNVLYLMYKEEEGNVLKNGGRDLDKSRLVVAAIGKGVQVAKQHYDLNVRPAGICGLRVPAAVMEKMFPPQPTQDVQYGAFFSSTAATSSLENTVAGNTAGMFGGNNNSALASTAEENDANTAVVISGTGS